MLRKRAECRWRGMMLASRNRKLLASPSSSILCKYIIKVSWIQECTLIVQQWAYAHTRTHMLPFRIYIKIHCESFLSHSSRDVIENGFNVCTIPEFISYSSIHTHMNYTMCMCACLFDECVLNVQPQQSLICSTRNSV